MESLRGPRCSGPQLIIIVIMIIITNDIDMIISIYCVYCYCHPVLSASSPGPPPEFGSAGGVEGGIARPERLAQKTNNRYGGFYFVRVMNFIVSIFLLNGTIFG